MQTQARVIKALGHLAECTKHLNDIQVASDSAKKAIESSIRFHKNNMNDLFVMRIHRAEQLMTLLRHSLKLFISQLSTLISILESPPSSKVIGTDQGAWNKLPESWWRQRAQLMSQRAQHIRHLATKIHQHDREAHNEEGYEYSKLVVDHVVKRAVQIVKEWIEFLGYVDGWKDLAVAINNGIGEPGCVLTSP